MPRELQERGSGREPGTEALSKELGRSPRVREVAHHLGYTTEQVLEASEAAASYEAASLDAPTSREDDEGASLVDMLGGEDSSYELVESRDAIASTWQSLPEVERKVVELRFMHDLTQREIGDASGTRRCTCRGCCAGPSPSWRTLQKPPERRAFSTAKPSQSLFR